MPIQTRIPALLVASLASVALAGCSAAPPGNAAPRTALPAPAAAARHAAPTDASAPVNEEGDLGLVPAPGLASALDHYTQGDFDAAAVSFFAALEAPSGRSKAELSVASFFLAKSLVKRGFRVVALPFFEGIARDPAHPYFDRTLFWLAHLADELPEDDPVLRVLPRYGAPRLGEGAPPQPPALLESARYYLGRAHYRERAFEPAIRLLSSVPAGSRWAVYARFFEGVSQLRLGDPDAASLAFEAAAREAPRSPGLEPDEAARLRDLAWMSLARLHYSKAKGEGEELSFAGADALKLALEAYARVGDDGGFSDEARLEQAWAFVRLGDARRALASLDALSGPFEETTPEAHYLRAFVHFTQCEVDKAAAVIAAFKQTYGQTAVEVERLGREAESGRDPASTRASPIFHAVVKSALGQRDVRRIFELLSVIKAEKELLAASSARLASSPLGARIGVELERASTAASDRVSEGVKKRSDRFVEESREEIGRAEKMAAEIDAIRAGLSKCRPRRAPR